jgi:hypothetical protein
MHFDSLGNLQVWHDHRKREGSKLLHDVVHMASVILNLNIYIYYDESVIVRIRLYLL